MNHPSEWARYYDAPKGTYRYKHKGTGVVRDTLMNIGKAVQKVGHPSDVEEGCK